MLMHWTLAERRAQGDLVLRGRRSFPVGPATPGDPRAVFRSGSPLKQRGLRRVSGGVVADATY